MPLAKATVAAGAIAFSLLAGCSAAPHTRAAGALTPLTVQRVAWNPAGAQVGRVTAVADAGKVVAVLGDAGATVLSSGAVVAVDRSVTDWVAAETIRGADGSPRWIVGVDDKGRLHYLRGLSSFEDVSARYALDGRRVLGLAMLDPTRVAFLLDGEIAVADGRRVTRYSAPLLSSLAGGAGSGAAVAADAVVFFDARMMARTFPLHGVTKVAIGADGRLYVTTARALYATTEQGELALVFDAGGDTLHGLAASGGHVWIADGAELGIVEGDHVVETRGAGISPGAKLAPSPSGDVWVIASGGVERFARAEPEAGLRVAWSSTLGPIFARSCASCHLPGGISGTDLSTAESWESERRQIAERVVEGKTMPPEGHPLSDADRATIAAWVSR
jgi:mono/diheme cytochrome c family protein